MSEFVIKHKFAWRPIRTKVKKKMISNLSNEQMLVPAKRWIWFKKYYIYKLGLSTVAVSSDLLKIQKLDTKEETIKKDEMWFKEFHTIEFEETNEDENNNYIR